MENTQHPKLRPPLVRMSASFRTRRTCLCQLQGMKRIPTLDVEQRPNLYPNRTTECGPSHDVMISPYQTLMASTFGVLTRASVYQTTAPLTRRCSGYHRRSRHIPQQWPRCGCRQLKPAATAHTFVGMHQLHCASDESLGGC